VYSELPPVLGRQPTFESADVALQRLIQALDGDDPTAQEEAACSLCARAQEGEGRGFERLIAAGLLPPLIALLETGSDVGKLCSVLTLGLIAPVAAAQTCDSGGVRALLSVLHVPRVGEYAALALATLAEQDGTATGADIVAAGGFQALVEALSCDDVPVADACAGVLINILVNQGAEATAVAEAVLPVMEHLHALAGRAQSGTDEQTQELAQTAASLIRAVQAGLGLDDAPVPPAQPQPLATPMKTQKKRRSRWWLRKLVPRVQTSRT